MAGLGVVLTIIIVTGLWSPETMGKIAAKIVKGYKKEIVQP